MSTLVKRYGKYYLYWWEGGKKKGRAISTDRLTALEYQTRHDKNSARARLGLGVRDVSWFDFCEQYMAYARTNKAPRSILRDDFSIRVFNKLVPLINIAGFNASALERYKSIRKDAGRKASTINRELNTLKNMGNKLVDFGYAEINPVKSVKWLIDKNSRKVRYLDVAEIKTLLNTAWEPWRIAVLIGLYTGMRRGEVIHLTWDDVDLVKRTVTIQGRGDWHPKDYEVRVIPLNDRLVSALAKLRASAKGSNLVAYPDGRAVDEGVLTTMTRKIFKKANIQGASFHVLRHTFASHLIMSGVDFFVVSKLLGHASVKVTEVYSHLRPEFMKNTVEKLKY